MDCGCSGKHRHVGPGKLVIAPLFVPGNRPDRFAKAAASGADGIIIDLEDAVSPAAKGQARQAITAFEPSSGIPVFIRINARNTPWHAEDLAAVVELPEVGIMLPKAESTRDIETVLNRIGMDHAIIVLIESAAGLGAARTIAALTGVTRLAFGSLDYCADTGCAPVRDALLAPRSEMVLASRLAGLEPPLDGISTDLERADVIKEEARYAAELGFGGKLCIHPAQIAPVMAGFMPSKEELAWAQRVLAMDYNGAAAVEGRMIDAAELRRARGILDRHLRIAAKAGKAIQ